MQEEILIDEKKKFSKQNSSPNNNEEQVFSIQEFCTLKKLNKYYYDSLSITFNNKIKKTINNWEKELVNSKLIDKKEFN